MTDKNVKYLKTKLKTNWGGKKIIKFTDGVINVVVLRTSDNGDVFEQ